MARRSDHTRPELKALILKCAREIVRESTVSNLSTRRIADRIGYTSGTIYQVFRNRDDLVEQMNAETLQLLFEHCSSNAQPDTLQAKLQQLARGFVGFAREHPNEWDAVISYPFAKGHKGSVEYREKISQLLGLLRHAITGLYTDDEEEQLFRDAHLLWSSFYGIFALAVAGRLGEDREIEEVIDDLVDLYVAART